MQKIEAVIASRSVSAVTGALAAAGAGPTSFATVAAVASVIRGVCAADAQTRIWVSGVAEPATIAAVPRYDIAV